MPTAREKRGKADFSHLVSTHKICTCFKSKPFFRFLFFFPKWKLKCVSLWKTFPSRPWRWLRNSGDLRHGHMIPLCLHWGIKLILGFVCLKSVCWIYSNSTNWPHVALCFWEQIFIDFLDGICPLFQGSRAWASNWRQNSFMLGSSCGDDSSSWQQNNSGPF